MREALDLFETGLIQRLESEHPTVHIRSLAADIAERGYTNPNAALISAARRTANEPGSRFALSEASATGATHSIQDIFNSEQAFCDSFNKLRLKARSEAWSEREFLHHLEQLAYDNRDAYIAHRLVPILAGARNAAREEQEGPSHA